MVWYSHRYSAIKMNVLESVLMRRMNLEPIIQSEVSQKEKDKYFPRVKVEDFELHDEFSL